MPSAWDDYMSGIYKYTPSVNKDASFNPGGSTTAGFDWTLNADDFLKQAGSVLKNGGYSNSGGEGSPTFTLGSGQKMRVSGGDSDMVFHPKGEITRGGMTQQQFAQWGNSSVDGQDGSNDRQSASVKKWEDAGPEVVNPADRYDIVTDASEVLGRSDSGRKVAVSYVQQGDKMVPISEPTMIDYKDRQAGIRQWAATTAVMAATIYTMGGFSAAAAEGGSVAAEGSLATTSAVTGGGSVTGTELGTLATDAGGGLTTGGGTFAGQGLTSGGMSAAGPVGGSGNILSLGSTVSANTTASTLANTLGLGDTALAPIINGAETFFNSGLGKVVLGGISALAGAHASDNANQTQKDIADARNQNALDQINLTHDNKLADQKAFGESVAKMKPMFTDAQQGIIGGNLKRADGSNVYNPDGTLNSPYSQGIIAGNYSNKLMQFNPDGTPKV